MGFAGKKNPTSGREVGGVIGELLKIAGLSYTTSQVVAAVSGDMAGATKHATVITDGAGRHDGFNRHHWTHEDRSRCAHIKLSGLNHHVDGEGGNRRRNNLVQKGSTDADERGSRGRVDFF